MSRISMSIVLYSVFLLLRLLWGIIYTSALGSDTSTPDVIDTASDALTAIGHFVTETNVGNRVEKKSFSDQVRLLFIVGLEGTGHHGWKAMLEECTRRGVCVPEKKLTTHLMWFEPKAKSIRGLFGSEEGDAVIPDFVGAFRRLQQIAKVAVPRLFYVGMEAVAYEQQISGMMSYPNFNGPMKSLNNPDVHILAALAEAAGIDLRIVVLQRDTANIYHSNIDTNSYGKEYEPRILQIAAEEMKAQLTLLDRRFFSCSDFDNFKDMGDEESDALMHFLHPQLGPIWKSMMARFVPPSNAKNNHTMQGMISHEITASQAFKSRGQPHNALQPLSRAYRIYQLHVRIGLIKDECARSE